MVRNPIRAISNLAVTTYNYGALGFKGWALGALECERLSNPGVPIYRDMVKAKRVIKDAEYHRKLEFKADEVECSDACLADSWDLTLSAIGLIKNSVSQYLGWDSSSAFYEVIALLKNQLRQTLKIRNASRTLSSQQSIISERFCALYSSSDECWREIGSPDIYSTEGW